MQITGLPLNLAGGGRPVGLAAMLRIIVRRALVHVSDERLLPGGGASWSSLDLALVDGAEARLPELLKLLKNGQPSRCTSASSASLAHTCSRRAVRR